MEQCLRIVNGLRIKCGDALHYYVGTCGALQCRVADAGHETNAYAVEDLISSEATLELRTGRVRNAKEGRGNEDPAEIAQHLPATIDHDDLKWRLTLWKEDDGAWSAAYVHIGERGAHIPIAVQTGESLAEALGMVYDWLLEKGKVGE